MWGRRQRKQFEEARPTESAGRLKEALRHARIEQADRTAVVVDLHDAEIARLELLNDALDPLFEQVPADIDLFDRGLSRGETPRLWIDPVAHVDMGRDKRVYRLLQDTRYGRKVLAETGNVIDMVNAVTRYVAQRMIERERALADAAFPAIRDLRSEVRALRRRKRGRAFKAFLFGILLGFATLIAAALIFGPKG
jgi:hypothetical protein